MEISDRGTLAVLEKNNSNFGFEFQSLPEAFLTKTSVLLLAGISITWKLWITVMFGASWWPLQCKVMLEWVKIMIWHLVQLESLSCGNLFQFGDIANPPRGVTRTEVQIKLEGIKS